MGAVGRRSLTLGDSHADCGAVLASIRAAGSGAGRFRYAVDGLCYARHRLKMRYYYIGIRRLLTDANFSADPQFTFAGFIPRGRARVARDRPF